MHKATKELMERLGVKPEHIHLPTGGVAVFGRSGTGKSSIFYNSEFVKLMVVADTGSLAHNLYSKGEVVVVDSSKEAAPILQVRGAIERATKQGIIAAVDSFTALQEQQVAWFKRNSTNQRGPAVNLKDHQTIVGYFKDLALDLAREQVFTIFNCTPGGRGKTPDGNEVVYPAGAITGYPSLSGVGAGSETVLARWGCTWGVFQGYNDINKGVNIPRGLYVPGADIRPEQHANYSPLKDPMMILHDTSGGANIMMTPDLRKPENEGRSFVDELLVMIAAKYPKKQPATSKPAEKQGK